MYTVSIEMVSSFLLDELSTAKMEQHPFALSFINNIIKTSLRNSHLKQIGRVPRFFMPNKGQVLGEVETWPGFTTSSWIVQSGLFLVVDNISKFFSTEDCLTIINDRLRRLNYDAVSREFEGCTIMAKYGPQRTYRVNCIRWDLNPQTCFFESGEDKKKVSMVQYFQRVYEMKIYNLKQPLFEIKQKRQNIYLPPELCI